MDLDDYTFPHRLALESPYLADYFGLWQVEDRAFRGLVDKCNGVNLHAHLTSEIVTKQVSERDSRNYPVTSDGIAVFRANGPMMKSVPSMAEGVSTVRLRQQIRAARRDPEVLGAILAMDTPGGTSKGNSDLASDVAQFAASKPLYAFVEDMTASAGVSVASQANKRFANDGAAMYGAMGTYAVIEDLSGMAEQLGVKVHVIRAGEFKGMGAAGTEITEEHLAELQRIVNRINDAYLATIASGLRKPVEAIREMADGRIIMAADAVPLGLIDGVQSFDETYRQLVAAASKPNPGRSPVMAEKTPATLAELKVNFRNSTADWRESQLEAGASLSEAAIAYAAHVDAKAKEDKANLEKQLEEAKASKAAGGLSLGHKPLKQVEGDDDYQSETGDPVEDFNAAVAKVAGPQPDMRRRQNAVRLVASRNPELYQAYLLATNPGKRQARLITEKLESIAAGK